MKKGDLKKEIIFILSCLILAILIEINCSPYRISLVNKLLPWFRVVVFAFLLFLTCTLVKFIYEVCKSKNIIDKVKNNNIFKNIFISVSCIVLALIYYAMFIQPYEETKNIPIPLLILIMTVCIYLLYLLVIYMYKAGNEKNIDTERTNRVIALSAIIMYVVIAGALVFCTNDMQKPSFWKSDLVETSYLGMNDLSGGAPDYEITGKNPFVAYEIKDGFYNKGIAYFAEKASDNTTLVLYYAPSMDAFSEEHQVSAIQKKGTDYVVFNLPDDYQIHYLRVDYRGINSIEIGDKFHIEAFYAIKDTMLTKLHGFLTIQTFMRLLCLTIVFVALYFGVYKKNNLWERYYNNVKIRVTIEILMIFILPAVLFWKYISGQTCFIFSDIAGDSITQYYPGLLHLADRVKNGQWTEIFSFMVGLGNKEQSIIPNINNWVAMFGREQVAYLMGVSIFLKVALSGLFMYGLVSLWEIKDEKRLAVTLGYEFNAMLTIRSCWSVYPNIALMIILWLYCFELAYRKRQNKFYLLFALSSELFFMQFSVYYCVLYGFIFLVYIFCRVISDGNGIKLGLKYGFLNYGIFAFLGMADSLFSSFTDAVSSSRFSSNYGYVADHISDSLKFRWEMLYEAFIRSIGQAISGISDDFVGFENVLEGPAFYFGIFMLIILPVAHYNLPKKKKILFTLGLLASFLFITITGVRTLVAGFSGSSFKHTSFWITVLGVLMILEAFSNIKENGFKKNSLLVFNITAAICFLLIISILFSGRISRMPQWWLSLIYFLIYVMLVNLFYIYKIRALRWVFMLVIVTEGTVLSYSALNNRATYTIAKLNNLYYDDSYEAICEIKDEDNSWYRIEKYPVTISFCEPYVQNYYGTASYVGGTLIGKGVQNYYRELSLPNGGEMRLLEGTAGNLYANSLMGVKYIILNRMENFRYGTEYIASNGDVKIYKNTLALPIGFFYDEVIDADEFERLSYWDRNRVLLEKALCTSGDFEFDDSVMREKTSFVGAAVQYKFTSTQKGIDVSEIEGLLALDIHCKSESTSGNEEPLYGHVFWTDSAGTCSYQDFMTTGVLEVCVDDISYIWFDETIAEIIDYVNVYNYDADEYYAGTVSAIQKLQTNGMEVMSISDYEINGTIEAPSDGVFATSIPYDDNWEIYVDGVKTELLEVNTGFIGTKITEGNHDIRIYYSHRSWFGSNKFKSVGLVILLILGIYIIIDDMKKRNLRDRLSENIK